MSHKSLLDLFVLFYKVKLPCNNSNGGEQQQQQNQNSQMLQEAGVYKVVETRGFFRFYCLSSPNPLSLLI